MEMEEGRSGGIKDQELSIQKSQLNTGSHANPRVTNHISLTALLHAISADVNGGASSYGLIRYSCTNGH
jgi:hypothetical protein